MKQVYRHRLSYLQQVLFCFVFIILAGCIDTHRPSAVQIQSDGTMMDSRSGLMWQADRSQRPFTSSEDVEKYLATLNLAGFTDWRLPTSQELWNLYFTNDYSMAGQLAKSIKMSGSYWTKDGEQIRAGYLEDSDDPGINRYFLDSKKGFVRAVRSMK